MMSLPEKADPKILKKVVRIFAAEMELPTVDIRADFFDRGGDSLMAENLIQAINKEFKQSFDVSIILDCPSPLTMAQYLSKGTVVGDYIKPVTDSTGDDPLLFVHGAFGDNFHLRLIGDEVKSRWKIVGIRAKGFVIGEKPHDSLPVLINDYIETAKNYLGEYPKFIAGNCGGGMIALQIASQIFKETGQRNRSHF